MGVVVQAPQKDPRDTVLPDKAEAETHADRTVTATPVRRGRHIGGRKAEENEQTEQNRRTSR